MRRITQELRIAPQYPSMIRVLIAISSEKARQ